MITPEDQLRRQVVAKVARRLISFIFVCYVVAYLDRANISFASGLKSDLNLTNTEYGWGKGLFFLGYFLFEVPSNLILHRVGARIWIARIMIVWGLVSMGMIFLAGKWSFYTMRVLLGLSEAGFFPGVVLYLTYWVPARERARMGALFMVAAPIAMAFGASVSGLLLKLHGIGGLKGWQWLFLIEGLPAVILGLFALKVLVSRPENAAWLTDEERDWLNGEIARERALKPSQEHAPLKASLLNPKVWILCLFWFLNTSVTYGIFLWLGEILESLTGFKEFKLGLLTAATLVPAIVGMILITAHSDRTGERRWHLVVCALVAAIGLVLTTLSGKNVWAVAASFAICHLGQRTIQGLFWAIPPVFLGGTAAAAGIAFINSIGNLGGHFGPSMMGWLKDKTEGYNRGLLVLAATLVVEAAVILLIRMPPKLEAKPA